MKFCHFLPKEVKPKLSYLLTHHNFKPYNVTAFLAPVIDWLQLFSLKLNFSLWKLEFCPEVHLLFTGSFPSRGAVFFQLCPLIISELRALFWTIKLINIWFFFCISECLSHHDSLSSCKDFKDATGTRVVPVTGCFVRVWCFARKNHAIQMWKQEALDKNPGMKLWAASLAPLPGPGHWTDWNLTLENNFLFHSSGETASLCSASRVLMSSDKLQAVALQEDGQQNCLLAPT